MIIKTIIPKNSKYSEDYKNNNNSDLDSIIKNIKAINLNIPVENIHQVNLNEHNDNNWIDKINDNSSEYNKYNVDIDYGYSKEEELENEIIIKEDNNYTYKNNYNKNLKKKQI